MSTSKKVSVIIPTHNAQKFIYKTLQSVFGQSVQPDEVIIVDDGSTDNFRDEIKEYSGNIEIVEQANRGVPSARNTGLLKSTGDYIAFIDADDIWCTNKTEHQLDILQRNLEIDLVIGLYSKFNEEVPVDTNPEFRLSLGSSLIRKEAFNKIGHFDEEMFIGEDTDWFYRAREAQLKIFVHEAVVQYYRVHGQGITSDNAKKNYYTFVTLKKALERRKNSSENYRNSAEKSRVMNESELRKYWHTLK